MYSRKPLKEEILDNLKDDVDDSDLNRYLNTYSEDGDINNI